MTASNILVKVLKLSRQKEDGPWQKISVGRHMLHEPITDREQEVLGMYIG